MDALLQSLQLGFILRSLFAGVFFVVAYQSTGGELAALSGDTSNTIFTAGLPLAILVGVTVYSLHRSLVYPLVEHILNSTSAVELRKKYPLISINTVSVIKKYWYAGAEKGKEERVCIQRMGAWADYTHMQYASAICVGTGSLARIWSTPGEYGVSWPIISAVMLFTCAGIVSDWRLHAVREQLGFGDGIDQVAERQ